MAVPSRAKLLSSNKYEKTVLKADDPLGVGLMPSETEEQRMRRNERGVKRIKETNLVGGPRMTNYLGLGSPRNLADVIEKQENVAKEYNNPGAIKIQGNQTKLLKYYKDEYGATIDNPKSNKSQLLRFPIYSKGRSALENDLRIKAMKDQGEHGVTSASTTRDFVNMYVAGGKSGRDAYEKARPGQLDAYELAIEKAAAKRKEHERTLFELRGY